MSEVQAIDRAFALLELLASDNRPAELSASELAKLSGLHVATVRRLLSSLKAHGFVAQHPETKKYRLGLGLVRYGVMVWQSIPIRDYARASMEELWRRTQETVYLIVREGHEGVLVDKIDTPHPVKLVEPLGKRTPLYVGAAKKVILAFLPPKVRESLLRDFDYRAYTDRTTPNAEQLRSEIDQIAELGYAVSFGELTRGTAAVAAPIFDARGVPVAAISVDGPADRFSADKIAQFAEEVKSAARSVSGTLKQVGYGLVPVPPQFGAGGPLCLGQ